MAERVITSSLISSESANNVSDAAERLFSRILVSPTTDQWGRRDASLRKLRADCVPLLDWTDEKLLQSLEELVREGMCELYCVDGRYYLSVSHWDRYQRTITRLRRGRSVYPAPPSQPQPEHGSVDSALLEVANPPPNDRRTTGERPASDRRTTGGRDGLISGCSSDVVKPSASASVQSAELQDFETEETDELLEASGIGSVIARIPGATARTPVAVLTVMRKYRLPEGVLYDVIDRLQRRSGPPIGNPAGWVVRALEKEGKQRRGAVV